MARRRSTWAARHSDRFAVTALVAHSSSEKLFEQVRQFHPKIAALSVEPKEIPADIKNSCQWMFGENVLLDVVHACDADDVLVSVVGVVGLAAVMETLACGKRVLLANKEPLVAGGELVTEAAKKAGHPLLPVDSEHSAIFQCLQGAQGNTPTRLILTASGGPFRTWKKEDIYNARPEQALKHPNWSMGRQDHHRFRVDDEQGAGGHRGALAVRHARRENRCADSSTERHTFYGRIRGRRG